MTDKKHVRQFIPVLEHRYAEHLSSEALDRIMVSLLTTFLLYLLNL
jgi:hypothetical protein